MWNMVVIRSCGRCTRIACADFDSSRSYAKRIHGLAPNHLNVRSEEHQLTQKLHWPDCLPGSQHSSTYPLVNGGVPEQSMGTGNCSKPVPPVGKRTKRFVIGVVKCDPGRNERAPFSAVHFSRGIQNPRADGGSVYCLWDQVSVANYHVT